LHAEGIASDAPVETMVPPLVDSIVPVTPRDMGGGEQTFAPHEAHRGAGHGDAERPGETALGAGPTVVASPHQVDQISMAAVPVVDPLLRVAVMGIPHVVVRTGEIIHHVPCMGKGGV